MNNNAPPATIKLFTVIPKVDNICVPAIPKTINKIADVMAALFDNALLVPFSIFLVKFINIGIIPNGSTTASNCMVDVKTLLKKLSRSITNILLKISSNSL
jgi:hypothetical protein